MITTQGMNDLVVLNKDLISDQTYAGLSKKLNTAGLVFSAGQGITTGATATSSILCGVTGGFPNQQMQSTMKFIAPTAAGSEDLGCILRCSSTEDANYYYARVTAGVAKISKVVAGTFTTLTSSAWVIAQNTNFTVAFSVIGNTFTALYQAGGAPADLTLSVTDSSIAAGGCMGVRSLTSTATWSTFNQSQLPL